MVGRAMSVVQPDRMVAERVELRQVPVGLARVLAGPEANDPGSRSWARGFPLPGTQVAARNLVRQASGRMASLIRVGLIRAARSPRAAKCGAVRARLARCYARRV